MARFLHFYPQYSLDDLRNGRLQYDEFMFLVGGMFDVEEPERTESQETKVSREVRAIAVQAAEDRARRGY